MSKYKIFKYEVVAERQGTPFVIEIPKYSRILSLHLQGRQPMMWVLANEKGELQKRNFIFFGTGRDLPANIENHHWYKFIGTFLVNDDKFVYHLFEILA